MADRIIFVCILLLAGGYFYATEQLPSLEIGDPLGPKAFPRLLTIALLITAGVYLFEMLRARKGKGPAVEAPRSGATDAISYKIVTGLTIWTFLYFFFFEPLGYVIATTIYLLAVVGYFHRGPWLTRLIVPPAFALGSYLIFTKLLGVNLARGVLPI